MKLSFFKTLLIYFLTVILCPIVLDAQSIGGDVVNENGEPVPLANIYVEQTGSGTAADIDGKYFLTLNPGTYNIVISALGYESKGMEIVVSDLHSALNITLGSSGLDLEEIIVTSSRKDPAYAIIRNASENRKRYLKQVESSRVKVYLKATEEVDNTKKKKEPRQQLSNNSQDATAGPEDPFAEEEKRKLNQASKLNMVEMEAFVNYQLPNDYKEERTAFKAYGDKKGLFIPLFSETNFNFYENMVDLNGIAEVPVISPISRTAILSYKFKLIESTEENGQLVHKIKVIPRKKGNSTVSGFIYINEELWNINRLDVQFTKGALRAFDDFQLKQEYSLQEDSLWIADRIEFIYSTKFGRYKNYYGNTLISFSEFQNNYEFPPRFFKNEVSVTSKEAYKRDSMYWDSIRVVPLTEVEREVVDYRDSVDAVVNSKEYQDSIQAEYNKIQLLDLVWDGVGFRNNQKKSHLLFPPIPELLDFELVGGFRVGPSLSYSRQWENGQRFSFWGEANIGLRNKDIIGEFSSFYRYNPHKLSDIRLKAGRDFESVNAFESILNQLKSSNYILNDFIRLSHRFEVVNGLFLKVRGKIDNRHSIEGLDSRSFINDVVINDQPLVFDDYVAFITETSLSYTPGQKYMTEPTRKVILGSKWPTFTLYYERGWPGVFTSEVHHDYLGFNINQNILLGMLGNSKYRFKTGKFLNTKNLRYVDLKRFQRSNPYWQADPLNAFQLLDSSLIVRDDLFLEFHHIHHFNGALINNIPLIKKTRVNVVVGGGALWVKESNYLHGEVYAGLERVFKIGPRRRMRLGAYGVFAESNNTAPDTQIKFSIDIIDTWKREWDF